MAADVEHLEPRHPGGALPWGKGACGLVTEAAGTYAKGLPPTALRRASLARLGLN